MVLLFVAVVMIQQCLSAHCHHEGEKSPQENAGDHTDHTGHNHEAHASHEGVDHTGHSHDDGIDHTGHDHTSNGDHHGHDHEHQHTK